MPDGRKIEIYRAAQAQQMTSDDGNFERPATPAEDGMARLFEAGLAKGNVTKRHRTLRNGHRGAVVKFLTIGR